MNRNQDYLNLLEIGYKIGKSLKIQPRIVATILGIRRETAYRMWGKGKRFMNRDENGSLWTTIEYINWARTIYPLVAIEILDQALREIHRLIMEYSIPPTHKKTKYLLTKLYRQIKTIRDKISMEVGGK